MQSPHYVVGIDLGTTHTVVAYASTDANHQDIHLFNVEQLIAPGLVAEKALLPSVRYHPAPEELSNNEINFPSYAKDAYFSDMPVVLVLEPIKVLSIFHKHKERSKSWPSLLNMIRQVSGSY